MNPQQYQQGYPPPMGQASSEGGGIDIGEILQIVKSLVIELIYKSWIIALLGAGLGYYMHNKSKQQKREWTANLSFILNMANGSGAQRVDVFSSFGLQSETSSTATERFLELMKSRTIIASVLLTKAKINKKTDYLANHYIDLCGLREIWEKKKKENLLDFRFETDSLENFSRLENSIMNQIHGRVKGTHLRTWIGKGEIINMSIVSPHELFSYRLANSLFSKVSEYFVEKSIEREIKLVEKLESRADSLSGLLTFNEGRVASTRDGNQLAVRSPAKVKLSRIQKDMEVIYEAYVATVESLQYARDRAANLTPVVQLVDGPIMPLPSNSINHRRALIMGAFIGAVLGVLLVIGRRLGLDFLKKELAKSRARKEAQMETEEQEYEY